MASVGVVNLAPVVIGATGGSGTRVVARIAKLAGYNLGTNLNSAEDALEFYSFHDKWINPFVCAERVRKKMTPWQLARTRQRRDTAKAFYRVEHGIEDAGRSRECRRLSSEAPISQRP